MPLLRGAPLVIRFRITGASDPSEPCAGLLLPGVPTPTIADDTTFAVSADFDGDGNMDIASPGNGIHILLGLGDSRFRPAITSLPERSLFMATVADLDGDDRPDLVAWNSNDSSLSVLML